VTLDEFTTRFYSQAAAANLALPDNAKFTLQRIVERDLLGQYRSVDGVRKSLRRLSMQLSTRWQRDFKLDASMTELIEHEDALAADFAEFFPQLQAHVAQR
jgi:acyl carrier protein phosphodiesterase